MAERETSAARGRIADVIAHGLADAGVEWVAGHPGGEVTALIDALHHASIRFVLTHHETTAAFMAAGHGELTGRPGVALATLGPGATNMVTGVANAFLDRAPMIAITGSLATNGPPGKTHQNLDLSALYSPVTKASTLVTAENAREVVKSAVEVATTWPMGPVHLAVPSDVATMDAGKPRTGGSREAVITAAPAGEGGPSESALDQARHMLRAARRPALICGLGALQDDVAHQLAAIARTTGAAVAVTPKAKGAFDETDPRFAGVLEVAGDDLVLEFLGRADVLLHIGLDIVELDKAWRLDAPAIVVDRRPHQEGFFHPELELVGDPASILETLAGSLDATDGWPLEEIREQKDKLRSYLCPGGASLTPWQAIDMVWDSYAGRAIVTSDTGAHKFLVGQLWKTREPKTFFVSNGLSSMGYAIPTAAAACMTSPDVPVVAFVGDGGISMYLGEIGTLQRLQLNLVMVVFVDGSLELIRRSQHERGFAEEGTRFDNPDFRQIAKAYGAMSYSVHDATELRDALEQAKQPGVHLIAARISGHDYRL